MSVSEGLRLISVTKSLTAYQSDANINTYFGATRLAGRAGLFLSSLRSQTCMTWRKFAALAASFYIDTPTLKVQIKPWLESEGFVEVEGTNDNDVVECNVVDYEAILRSTSSFFWSLGPTHEEILVLELLDCGIRVPTTKSDAFNSLSSYSEEVINRALELASGYSIVKVLDNRDVREPVFYSPLIWGNNIAKAGKALSHLDNNRRAVLLQLVESIRGYQGVPDAAAKTWAKNNGEPDLVEFAVGLGLLDRTAILSNEGGTTSFLTTPHLFGELAATHGKDVCDRIRLFLDSIRHGQYYGQWFTGRIQDPVKLLGKLVDTGEIGPCTAIGQDYVLVEKAGIVTVRPSSAKPNQFIMELVQKDTVTLIRDILTKTDHPPDMNVGLHSGSPGQDRFVSSEQARGVMGIGKLPEPMRRAEAEMIRKLREMECWQQLQSKREHLSKPECKGSSCARERLLREDYSFVR
jgi:hypothetical protein